MSANKEKMPEPKVGLYANECGYSDINPYEIVRIVSAKCIEVRHMDCVPDPEWKPEVHKGGFAAHISNDRDQKWIITPSQSKQVLRLRLRKDGFWWSGGMRFRISEKPVKFYDNNF